VKPANRVALGLKGVALPPLVRPPVGPTEPPTEDLIIWSVCSYAYSAIAHVRTILNGLVALEDVGNQPTILIVARHLYEWTMHSSYVLENFAQHLATKDLNSAWEFFLTTDTGNSWIKRHGSKYDPRSTPDDVPDSVRVKKLVGAHKRYELKLHGNETVEDDYGYLSEHSHANGFCLQPYRKLKGRTINFVESPISRDLPNEVHVCSIDWLMCMEQILALGQEDDVRLHLVDILKSLVQKT
jgi:hypothetical protein